VLQNIVIARHDRGASFCGKCANPIRVGATVTMADERDLIPFAICSDLHYCKGYTI